MGLYAHIELVVASSVAKLFGFLVMTRHNEFGLRRSKGRICPTILPKLLIPTRTLKSVVELYPYERIKKNGSNRKTMLTYFDLDGGF